MSGQQQAARGAADFFLHVQTRRAGKLKGEATAPGHEGDMLLVGWNWGMSSGAAVGDVQATARRSYSSLTVTKYIDSASTALMAALATNDEVKEAKLSLRKAGGEQQDYFTITLKGARITSLHHTADAQGLTQEVVALAFTDIEVQYTPQNASGQRSGATTFSDNLPRS
ncbi:MAG: type VI secretion system tube protein Hcp [Rubrivivax sp.]|nr:MAG: type VI secretion system tube protein Hcp [Rubrivivax sp.]